MIKIIYFDERKSVVKREIETKAFKGTETKVTEVLPNYLDILEEKGKPLRKESRDRGKVCLCVLSLTTKEEHLAKNEPRNPNIIFVSHVSKISS